MVETGILNRYLSNLPQEITTCIDVRSYFITDNEAKLLHEINCRHCEYLYHKDGYSKEDVIVRASEAKAFHKFLETCYYKLCVKPIEPSEYCGFVRINGESVVPYTVKEKRKYVPLFYFEGETDTLKLKAEKIDGWELAYLKFCCKVQGIRNELFASDTCAVVSLDDVKQYFPKDTQFEDWWPAKTAEPMRVVPNSNTRSNMNWLNKPAQQPPSRPSPSVPQQNGNSRLPAQTTNSRQHHQPTQQAAHNQYQYNHLSNTTNGYPKTSQTAQPQHRSNKHTSATPSLPTSQALMYNILNNPAAASLLSSRNPNNLMAQNSLMSLYQAQAGYNQSNYQSQQLQSLASQLAGTTNSTAALNALLQQQQQQYNAAASALTSNRRLPSQHIPTSSASRHAPPAASPRQQQHQSLASYGMSSYNLEALMAASRPPQTYAQAQTTQTHSRATRANKRQRM